LLQAVDVVRCLQHLPITPQRLYHSAYTTGLSSSLADLTGAARGPA
jgi:hypothetical protein